MIPRDSRTKACLLQKMGLEDEGNRTSPGKGLGNVPSVSHANFTPCVKSVGSWPPAANWFTSFPSFLATELAFLCQASVASCWYSLVLWRCNPQAGLSGLIKRKHELLFQYQLQLATWKVLGVSTLQQDFQRTYSCKMERGHKYHLPVCLEKLANVADVLKGKLISFQETSNHFWNF